MVVYTAVAQRELDSLNDAERVAAVRQAVEKGKAEMERATRNFEVNNAAEGARDRITTLLAGSHHYQHDIQRGDAAILELQVERLRELGIPQKPK